MTTAPDRPGHASLPVASDDDAVIAFGDQGSGRPIVFVPGICCSRKWWDLQCASLAHSNRVICVDLRGIGESPQVAHGHRVARYALDVGELLERLDLHGVVLVGWSLGCSINLALVELVGQERLAGLVLVEGSPKLLAEAAWPHGIADLSEGARIASELRDGFEGAVQGLMRSLLVDPDADAGFPSLLADALRADPASTARLFWDHFNQDWRDVLAMIRVPTLVVAGTASRIVDPGASEYLAAAVPDGRLELFEGAGHALFREQPERFNALLQEFVERL